MALPDFGWLNEELECRAGAKATRSLNVLSRISLTSYGQIRVSCKAFAMLGSAQKVTLSFTNSCSQVSTCVSLDLHLLSQYTEWYLLAYHALRWKGVHHTAQFHDLMMTPICAFRLNRRHFGPSHSYAAIRSRYWDATRVVGFRTWWLFDSLREAIPCLHAFCARLIFTRCSKNLYGEVDWLIVSVQNIANPCGVRAVWVVAREFYFNSIISAWFCKFGGGAFCSFLS